MPLINCPDCGGPVSTVAPACPRCGRPNSRDRLAALIAPPPETTIGMGHGRYELKTVFLDWSATPIVVREKNGVVGDDGGATRDRLFRELKPLLEEGWEFYPDWLGAIDFKEETLHYRGLYGLLSAKSGNIEAVRYLGATVQLRRRQD